MSCRRTHTIETTDGRMEEENEHSVNRKKNIKESRWSTFSTSLFSRQNVLMTRTSADWTDGQLPRLVPFLKMSLFRPSSVRS